MNTPNVVIPFPPMKRKPDKIVGVRLPPGMIADIKARVPLSAAIRNFSEQVRHLLAIGLDSPERRQPEGQEKAA